MAKKLILATDGSEFSLRAAEAAANMAKAADYQVTVMYVVPQPVVYNRDLGTLLKTHPDLEKDIESAKDEIVGQTTAKLDALNVPYELKVVSGEPADVIIREAEDAEADLIVMGTRGQSGVTRFLMGSVSTKVVNHAPCSVMVIK